MDAKPDFPLAPDPVIARGLGDGSFMWDTRSSNPNGETQISIKTWLKKNTKKDIQRTDFERETRVP